MHESEILNRLLTLATAIMGTSGQPVPSVDGAMRYSLTFLVRYFAVTGGLYWFFHVAYGRRWAAWRIQAGFPTSSDVRYEIRWAATNAALTGLTTWPLYWLISEGRASMYFRIGDRGYAYFGLSILLCIVGNDAWAYWTHRLMHVRWWFRHVHSIHHRVSNPTAFSAFAQHPVETFLGNAYFLLFALLVPAHPLAIGVAALYMFVFAINAHHGYEFFPRGFTRNRVFRWVNTSTHHNLHHRHVRWNYGTWFNFWDFLMSTNHPEYHDTFDALHERPERAVGSVGEGADPYLDVAAVRRVAPRPKPQQLASTHGELHESSRSEESQGSRSRGGPYARTADRFGRAVTV